MNLENEVAIVGSVFEGNEKLRTALTGLKTLSESELFNAWFLFTMKERESDLKV